MTKTSGLLAAASLLATHEIAVNEAGTSKKVTGAQIRAAVAQGTGGGAWYAALVANSAAFSALTDIAGLAITITPLVGRRIRVKVSLLPVGSVSGDQWTFTIQEGATILQTGFFTTPTGGNPYVPPVIIEAILTPTNAAHTYKLTGVRSAGTGTLYIQATATAASFILGEDIGT